MRKLMVFAIIITIGIYFFRSQIVPKVIKNDWKMVNFKTLTLPSSPNFFLSCYRQDCPANEKEHYQASPVFNANRHQLMEQFDNVIKNQPRIRLLKSSHSGTQRIYVQLSAVWHFPDFIYVQFIEVGSGQSSINIFSQSHYGYSDFGVNAKRVKSWLGQLSS